MLAFLHISDTHISADPGYHPDWIRASAAHPNRGLVALRAAIEALPFAFDFILHTGDVCADPLAEHYRCARDLLLEFPAPMLLLPGNHDSADLMRAILHDGRRLRVLGDAHVQFGNHHLLTLDSNGDGDAHAPALADEQIDFLARELDATGGQPTIVAMHHAPLETGLPYLDERMRIQNGERVHQLLRGRRDQVAGVFHGHIHQETATVRDGIPYFCCQSTWSNLVAHPGQLEAAPDRLTPGGFNLVLLRGTRAFLRRYHLPPTDA